MTTRGSLLKLMAECGEEMRRIPDCRFSSDNCGKAHPDVIASMTLANDLPAARPYGECSVTKKAGSMVREALGVPMDTHVRFVTSGTGANVLGLSLACGRPYFSIILAKCAHVGNWTAGACEHELGVKLIFIEGDKIEPAALMAVLKKSDSGPEYFTFPKVITLTQANEMGVIYTLHELEAIRSIANEYNLLVHIDGARFMNACVALADDNGFTPQEAARRVAALADIISFGGAKNGLATAEAVVIKSNVVADETEVKAAQKQKLLIVSKARYIASQFIAYMNEDLFVENAVNANRKASYLAGQLKKHPGIIHVDCPQTNQIMACMSPATYSKLATAYAVFPWSEGADGNLVVRIITSWDTTDEDCDAFVKALGSV
ncbi:Low specificity L-threonine aldolase [Diplonema papillatum]|nr:Low specificity L-threonine aldolase [Diplonema papillatum]